MVVGLSWSIHRNMIFRSTGVLFSFGDTGWFIFQFSKPDLFPFDKSQVTSRKSQVTYQSLPYMNLLRNKLRNIPAISDNITNNRRV